VKDKAVYLMAFSPHPADTEFGIGGTVAHMTREGKNVVYVVCTNGDKGSSDPNMKPEELARIREREQLAAARLLGVQEVIFLRHPDLSLEDTPEFRKEILRLILGYRPEVVATCDPYQRYLSNRDHRVLGRLVLDAVWPYALAPNTYRDLLGQGFQLHRTKEVLLWHPTEPNYRCNIDDTYDIKMAACRCHKSQIGDPVESTFVEYLMKLTVEAAQGQSYKLGEAFHRLEVLQRL
jgi:LmbE family N-acetylglucosaminyl deacetylase